MTEPAAAKVEQTEPCPFCGQHLEAAPLIGRSGWVHPGQRADGSCILAGFSTEAWKAWNRRSPDHAVKGLLDEATRPIIGIKNRTPQEVFDIMVDRMRRSANQGATPDV